MKIFVVCSKHFYQKIPPIAEELKRCGHEIIFPNSYNEPFKEERMKKEDPAAHVKFKQEMMRLHEPKVRESDALLVLNFEKNGLKDYIGGATFMEIVKAWELNKAVYFYNPLPRCIFTDELTGINPAIINGDLTKIPKDF